MIDNYANDGFDVFPASESILSKAHPLGAAGCFSAPVNMNPAGIHAVFQKWNTPEGAELQAKADVIRQILQGVSMIPAMKRVVSDVTGDLEWRVVRPPLVKLDDDAALKVKAQLYEAGFQMKNYPKL